MKRFILSSMICSTLCTGYLYARPDMHKAVQKGKPDKVMRIFEENNLDTSILTQTDKKGYQPIHIAVKHNKPDMISLLLNLGANINAQTPNGLTPLELAREKNKKKARDTLYEHWISHIIKLGDIPHLKETIERWPDAATTAIGPRQPIHIAARYNRPDIIDTLLKHGANVNARTQTMQETPLHLASTQKTIATLIKAGGDPNLDNKDGETPLHNAARLYADACKPLLQAGANPNVQDSLGNTPLHNAVANHNADTVSLLLEHDANIHLRNNEGQTPMDVATTEQHKIRRGHTDQSYAQNMNHIINALQKQAAE